MDLSCNELILYFCNNIAIMISVILCYSLLINYIIVHIYIGIILDSVIAEGMHKIFAITAYNTDILLIFIKYYYNTVNKHYYTVY